MNAPQQPEGFTTVDKPVRELVSGDRILRDGMSYRVVYTRATASGEVDVQLRHVHHGDVTLTFDSDDTVMAIVDGFPPRPSFVREYVREAVRWAFR